MKTTLPFPVDLKLDLLFEGVRYSPALGAAGAEAQPNFYPYRFAADEPHRPPDGKATIPYLLDLEDDTLVRIKGEPGAPYHVLARDDGYELRHDAGLHPPQRVRFEPHRRWMQGTCTDGTPMAAAGVSAHGDMLVVNPAPACQYFVAPKRGGRSLRCAFCLYGRPDARAAALGQKIDDPLLPAATLARMQEVVRAAVAEGGVRHVYIVAGSMLDWHEEAARYLQLARALRDGCPGIPYLACGSGALPLDALRALAQDDLVDGVCFNLEVYGARLFEKVCPGKAYSVGYQGWLASLEQSVGLFGAGNVYSAMVTGIELEPEYDPPTLEQAVDECLRGATDLLGRGVLPIYSLYWPLRSADYASKLARLRDYFSAVNLGYLELRREAGMRVNPAFMCHRCSYMQLECDLDRLG